MSPWSQFFRCAGFEGSSTASELVKTTLLSSLYRKKPFCHGSRSGDIQASVLSHLGCHGDWWMAACLTCAACEGLCIAACGFNYYSFSTFFFFNRKSHDLHYLLMEYINFSFHQMKTMKRPKPILLVPLSILFDIRNPSVALGFMPFVSYPGRRQSIVETQVKT